MENLGRPIESTNGEIELPEQIIQHIQYFLTGKQAAQTSILSKSWYTAWSTHPVVDFDQRYFSHPREFAEFIWRTLGRYENLNQKIGILKVWCCDVTVKGDWIGKAMELGARYILNKRAFSKIGITID